MMKKEEKPREEMPGEKDQREEKQRELIEIRRLTGMNRKEFALEYDIPYQTITDWELGHRRVPKYFLRLLRYKVMLEEGRRFDAVSPAQAAGMKEVRRQMSLDYCCSLKDLEEGSGNLFTEYHPMEGRRRFNETEETFLKIASFKGRLLFTGRQDIIRELQGRYAQTEAAWFMEPGNMRELNELTGRYGYRISHLHPFYVAFEQTPAVYDQYEVRLLERADIEEFRGDSRFTNAFSFQPAAPDEIGISASKDGRILAMAGASGDSPLMWQIGIDVVPEARGLHLGRLLVTLLKNEILKRGRIPYYGTAFSHILSQNIAIDSGFRACWTELVASKTGDFTENQHSE